MAGKYRAYSEYKNSGVEWLGDVPKHWTVCRIKNVSKINPSKSEARCFPYDCPVSFNPMEAEHINKFFEIRGRLHDQADSSVGGIEYKPDINRMMSRAALSQECVEACIKHISQDGLAEIAALYEQGRFRSFSEQYSKELSGQIKSFRYAQEKSPADFSAEIQHYLSKTSAIDAIKTSLQQLGQMSILASLYV